MGLSPRVLLGSISFLGIIGSGWVLTNYSPKSIGNILVVLSVIAFIFSLLYKQIGAFFQQSFSDAGAPLRLKLQFLLGGLLGFIPIVLSLAFSLSIGTPSLSVNENIRYIIVVFLAPIVEESFFLFVVPFFLARLLQRYGVVGFVVNLFLSSFIFAIYHWLAYGAVFGLSSAFIGAFVFRLITLVMVSLLSRSTQFTPLDVARGIVIAVIMHFMFNGFIETMKLLVTPEVVS
jgi:membrane protease YdiL (CAAX protease family)